MMVLVSFFVAVLCVGKSCANQCGCVQIANDYWWLHTQPKTNFTWEIDLRPAVEKW